MAASARGLALLLALLLAACGSPFGDCRSERVEVALPATVERGAGPEAVTLAGQVAPGNLTNQAEFELLRRVLTGADPLPPATIIWTVPAFDTNPGWIALAMRSPLRAGELRPVQGAFDGAGWGATDLAVGTDLLASVRAADFAADAASGTLEVLGLDPLRLRLDLGAEDDGRSIRVRGEASFHYVNEPYPCT